MVRLQVSWRPGRVVAWCAGPHTPGADADDVGQSVWLHLVDHLGKIRDPAALPGWLAQRLPGC